MNKPAIGALLCALAGLAGCRYDAQQAGARAAGTLALTSDDSLLYAVDADARLVAVVDVVNGRRVAKVQVGAWPSRIVVDAEDTAYVANRGERTVTVFRRGAWEDPKTVPAGVEPVDLALSRDGRTLYVVNASSFTDARKGSLMAIDTRSLQVQWDLELPAEARSIALVDDSKALVTLFREGDLVEVDLGAQRATRSAGTLRQALNRAPEVAAETGLMPAPPPGPMPGSREGPSTVTPRAFTQVAVSPEGDQVYVLGTLASDAVLPSGNTDVVIPDFPDTGGGSYGGGSFGCRKGGSVSTPALLTFAGADLSPRVDPVQECFNAESRDYPSTLLTGGGGVPIQGPSALLVDATGTFLYVANKESNSVAVLSTSQEASGGVGEFGLGGSLEGVIPVGKAPTGLALSRDGRRLFVHNAFSHTIQLITSSGSGDNVTFAATELAQVISPEENPLPEDVQAGRELFFSAADSRMNSPDIGISCASCHLDGREDGHVWLFSDGPRQTPSLAGRSLSRTAPFHWGGEHADFQSFADHTIGVRMGGSGLDEDARRKLLAFIDSIPAADNPFRTSTLTDAQLRGAQVFQKAECNTCHAGELFTNNTNANVGTFVADGPAPDNMAFFNVTGGLNTPSLVGVARTAPYLHDGSAATLRERIMRDKALDLHGKTSGLTDQEVDDLVAYLKRL